MSPLDGDDLERPHDREGRLNRDGEPDRARVPCRRLRDPATPSFRPLAVCGTALSERRNAVVNELTPNLRVLPAPPSNPPVSTEGKLVDEIALADHLGLSRSTLQSWRYAGRGPRYLKIGRLIRYRHEDVETFLRTSMCGAPG